MVLRVGNMKHWKTTVIEEIVVFVPRVKLSRSFEISETSLASEAKPRETNSLEGDK